MYIIFPPQFSYCSQLFKFDFLLLGTLLLILKNNVHNKYYSFVKLSYFCVRKKGSVLLNTAICK